MVALDTTPANANIIELLRQALCAGHRLLESRLQPYGLTPTDVAIMAVLFDTAGLSVEELSVALEISPESIATAVTTLVKDRILELTQYRAHLTERGQSMTAKCVAVATTVQADFFQELTPWERDTLNRLLHTLCNRPTR